VRSSQHDAYSVTEVQAPHTIHITQPSVTWAGANITTKTYEADGVFGPEVHNEVVWQHLPLDEVVEKASDGTSDQIFFLCAYGQTGSGKTYSTTYIEGKYLSIAIRILKLVLLTELQKSYPNWFLRANPDLRPCPYLLLRFADQKLSISCLNPHSLL
jgi:hypothetical protein